MNKTKSSPKLLAFFKTLGKFTYHTVHVLWLIVWTLYQIALGATLVLLVWGVIRAGEFFSLWEIRKLDKQNPTTTSFIETRREFLNDSLKAKGVYPLPKNMIEWKWIPFDSIPKVVQEVTLVAEDARFFEHQGFDLEEIEYALVANHQAGKKARGASTITQQVAKNLYLSSDKELSRKLREAVITFELEHFLSKERILELYLNIAQFDENVFGIRTAATHYYKKDLKQLTPDEAMNLICLLPSPTKWNFKKPSNAFLQHKKLVFKNYLMYKGMKLNTDSTQAGWQDSVFASFAEQISEDRWKGLRSRAMEVSTDTSQTDAESSGLGGGNAQSKSATPKNESQNESQIKNRPHGRERTF